MPNNKIKIYLKGILEHHKGRGMAISARDLAFTLAIKGGDADRRIRLMILELIWDGLPVLATPQEPAGFFLANSWEEYHEYDRQMKSRIAESAKRRVQVKKNVYAYFSGAERVKLL
jgi:hypothetical protein